MTDMVPFLYQNGPRPDPVRVVMVDGEPWFVAVDVARILGFRDAEHAVRGLDDDEKGTRIVGTLGGDQEVSVISESGLFALVLRSRRPAAKRFRKWVTAEVLPAIRHTGKYAIGTGERDLAKLTSLAHQQYVLVLEVIRGLAAEGTARTNAQQVAGLTGLSIGKVYRCMAFWAALGAILLNPEDADERLRQMLQADPAEAPKLLN